MKLSLSRSLLNDHEPGAREFVIPRAVSMSQSNHELSHISDEYSVTPPVVPSESIIVSIP